MNIKILLSLICLAMLSIAGADTSTVKDSYSIPKAQLTTYYQGKEPYVFFYPVGWSKNGKFAYFMEIRPGPYPICRTRYYAVIIDTVSNKEAWRHTLTKGEESCRDVWIKRDAPESLERVWPELNPIAASQFVKHGIVQTELSIDQLPFPGAKGKLKLIISQDFRDDMSMFYVQSAVVTLGGKTVAAISPMAGFTLDTSIYGFIASPFAAHFALIMNSFQLGQHYERVGPFYEITGVNLKGMSIQQK